MADDSFRCICDPGDLFDPPGLHPVAVEGCPAHHARRAAQLFVRRLDARAADAPSGPLSAPSAAEQPHPRGSGYPGAPEALTGGDA